MPWCWSWSEWPICAPLARYREVIDPVEDYAPGLGGLRVRLPLIRSELLNWLIVPGGLRSVSQSGLFILGWGWCVLGWRLEGLGRGIGCFPPLTRRRGQEWGTHVGEDL